MSQKNPIGPLASAYLRKCGYAEDEIRSWTGDTRLLHDIGLCGDDILDDFEILHKEFGVDLSTFDFAKYFPSELSMDAYLVTERAGLGMIGLSSVVTRVFDKYPPVTLETIESSIREKKWTLPSR